MAMFTESERLSWLFGGCCIWVPVLMKPARKRKIKNKNRLTVDKDFIQLIGVNSNASNVTTANMSK